jgi:hypothetical protein
MDLPAAILVDVLVVSTCSALLWRYGQLTALHPGAVYIPFHILVFTLRAWFVLEGAPTLFTGWGNGALPVSFPELSWALNLVDIALVSMTLAWIKVAADARRWHLTADRKEYASDSALLSTKVLWSVSAVAFPIGIIALLLFGNLSTSTEALKPRVELGEWQTSSWLITTQSWSGLILIALVYVYGFRKLYIIPLCLYLAFMSFQGYDRFRVVIPAIYLAMVWLTRKGRKWPPLWISLGALALMTLFAPMKTIGFMVQREAPISDIVDVAAKSITDFAEGHSGEQMILDEFASAVTLVDDSQRFSYGTLYYPLLTMPVPRQLWPDKPALNEYMREVSTPARPMAVSGMITTLHGESYANGGLVGVAAISLIVAYYLGRFYFAAIRKSYFSVYRFAYLLVACNLIQVYRDGLVSLIVFTVVNMLPLVAISLLSYIVWRAPLKSQVAGLGIRTRRAQDRVRISNRT